MSTRFEMQTIRSDARPTIETQIAFVLGHPGMSGWLKDTLRSALERDPIEILNDLEILSLILRNRAERFIVDGDGAAISNDEHSTR